MSRIAAALWRRLTCDCSPVPTVAEVRRYFPCHPGWWATTALFAIIGIVGTWTVAEWGHEQLLGMPLALPAWSVWAVVFLAFVAFVAGSVAEEIDGRRSADSALRAERAPIEVRS